MRSIGAEEAGRPWVAAPADCGFEDVYREHAAAVYRFCLSQLRDAGRAEEAAAEALASACLSWQRARPDAESLRPWLFRIARNAAVDQQRRAARSRRLLDRLRGGAAAVAGDVESEVSLRDDLRAVVAATARLGQRDRQVLGLRTAAGLSHAEVARVLGISEGAAKVATHRALVRLRTQLGRPGGA